jgi:hypothetical protein
MAATGKWVMAGLLLGVAVWLGWRAWHQGGSRGEGAFFYDLSAGKLFVGPRQAVPPIRGVDSEEEDAVRAVVISTNGNAADRRARTVAYLEKYSPEVKRLLEAAQVSGEPPPWGRGEVQAQRWVRRFSDDAWFSLSTPEGEQIVSAWLTAGPEGGPAVICSP